MVMKEAIDRITSRHIGRLLHRIEPIGTPQIVIDAIKREMWLMCDDFKDLVEGERKDGSTGLDTTTP